MKTWGVRKLDEVANRCLSLGGSVDVSGRGDECVCVEGSKGFHPAGRAVDVGKPYMLVMINGGH